MLPVLVLLYPSFKKSWLIYLLILHPFLVIRNDYAGPVLCKYLEKRSKRRIILVLYFIFFSTRTTHIELVTDCLLSPF